MLSIRAGLLAIAFATTLSLSCGGSDDQAPATVAGGQGATATMASGSADGGITPPATAAPEGTPPPAVGRPAVGAYRAVPVFPQFDFERMVELEWFPNEPDQAVVLTQQLGIIYRADLTEASAEPALFLDLSDKMIDSPANEEGLLGLAFAPDFASSRRFYVYYTAGDPRRSVVERYEVEGEIADAGSGRVVIEIPQPFPNHNGGALEFGPDGMLYIALGDGGSAGDPQGNGQNTDALLGKILRIDVSSDPYAVPPDNPFASGGGRGEVWAYGLRNPWRITFDAETGDLWTGDVGQNSLEEVDRVERGGNYGWNLLEGDECFRAETCDSSGKVAPRAVYPTDEGCAVTGGYVYRGNAMPELRGWYVYGDYCSGVVWAVNAGDESPPLELARTGKSISSFAQGPDRELYLVTFESAIYQLVRAQ